MSERQEIERAIGCYIEAMNTENPQIIPLAPDTEICGPMMPEPIEGEEAVRQYLGETAPFIARMTLKKSVIENDSAAVFVEFEGLNGVIIEGVYFFQFADGRICQIKVYFDTRPLIKGEK